jgi:hypothetical protein
MAKITLADERLRAEFPDIEWDEPVAVSLMGGSMERLGCRLCIARFGLKGEDIEKLYQTREEWEAHMEQFHR